MITVLSLLARSDRARMAETIDTIAFLQRTKAERPHLARLCAGAIAVLWGEVGLIEHPRFPGGYR